MLISIVSPELCVVSPELWCPRNYRNYHRHRPVTVIRAATEGLG